jgi:hypothetical protein
MSYQCGSTPLTLTFLPSSTTQTRRSRGNGSRQSRQQCPGLTSSNISALTYKRYLPHHRVHKFSQSANGLAVRTTSRSGRVRSHNGIHPVLPRGQRTRPILRPPALSKPHLHALPPSLHFRLGNRHRRRRLNQTWQTHLLSTLWRGKRAHAGGEYLCHGLGE